MGTQQMDIRQSLNPNMPRKYPAPGSPVSAGSQDKGKGASDTADLPRAGPLVVGEGMSAAGGSESWKRVKESIVKIIGFFFQWIANLEAVEANEQARSFVIPNNDWRNLTPSQMISKM